MFTVRHNAGPRKREKPLLVICLFLLLFHSTLSIKWLGIYREHNILWNQTKNCKTMKEHGMLNGGQVKICRKQADTMAYVQEAALLSINTCQQLFRDRRWNCSTIKNVPTLSTELAAGTRERAFVHALGAAALAYTIARGCASSNIKSCTCASHPDDPPNGNFKWGGCGDNVLYGMTFSRTFVDMSKKASAKQRQAVTAKTLYNHEQTPTVGPTTDNDSDVVEYSPKTLNKQIKLHNGEKGRTIVAESLVTHCKCHGVSGSCNIKTCWRGLPLKFHEIGEKLLASYAEATQIHSSTRPDHLEYRFNDSPALLYVAASPNYCEHDPNGGSFGTKGRECNISGNAQENCENMCCGRGYKPYILEKAEKCNCKYHWCCYVTCDTCKMKRQVHICN